MKWLFFLLLAANIVLGLFAYLREQAPNPDALLMQSQIRADQIRIVPPPEKPPAPQSSGARADAMQPTACMEWGTFGSSELARAQAAIDRLALGDRVKRVEMPVTVDYWVYIPPLRSREAMDRKVKELRDLGITEFYPVLEAGRWRYAISLGIFRNEEGARKFLANLRRKGVRSAIVGNREQRVSQTAFIVREPSVEESASLAVIKSDFAGTELRPMECPAG